MACGRAQPFLRHRHADCRHRPLGSLGAVHDLRRQRFLEFKAAVDRMGQTDHADWPLTGPRTLGWALRFISENYLTPDARHNRFMTEAKLAYADTGAAEHQSCCRVLYKACTYDRAASR